jgi:allantoinase
MAEERIAVDVGIIGGVVPGHLADIPGLYDAGVLAFKSFMVDSQSADFPYVDLDNLASAMQVLGSLARNESSASLVSYFPPYILHAELPPTDEPIYPGNDAASYGDYVASRPESWEVEAVTAALNLSQVSGCRIHIAHVSSAAAAELLGSRRIASAETDRLVSAETCPQYLLWAAEDVPDGRPEYKCAPPIRNRSNRAQLWKVLEAGRALDMVVSDHSPVLPTLKLLRERDVRRAWGGIAGLQYRLQATWTALLALDEENDEVQDDGGAAADRWSLLPFLSELLSGGAARVFGIESRKGSIAPGLDADFVIWDPNATSIIAEDDCFHKHKFSPYVGVKLAGVVHYTLLRGKVVFQKMRETGTNEEEILSASDGRVLFRSSTVDRSLNEASQRQFGVEAESPVEFLRHLAPVAAAAIAARSEQRQE